MPILRDDHARVGCLALPLSAVAGFVVLALVAAAVGLGATASTMIGLLGAAVGIAIAQARVRR